VVLFTFGTNLPKRAADRAKNVQSSIRCSVKGFYGKFRLGQDRLALAYFVCYFVKGGKQ
jgi:hypothetical protein